MPFETLHYPWIPSFPFSPFLDNTLSDLNVTFTHLHTMKWNVNVCFSFFQPE